MDVITTVVSDDGKWTADVVLRESGKYSVYAFEGDELHNIVDFENFSTIYRALDYAEDFILNRP